MDCLHGILMHDDTEQGTDHRGEDAFNRLQAADAVKGKSSGPCEGMDCLHGVLMHGDEDQGDDHRQEDSVKSQKAGPQKELQKQGPCEGMDCLHGVLMHGDEEHGKDHTKEDVRKVEQDSGKNVARGPCEGMDCMHGVLMHGDQEQGVEHAQEHAQMERQYESVKSGVGSADRFLHADGDDGAHEDEDDVQIDDGDDDDGDDVPAENENVQQVDFQDYAQWKRERDEEKSKSGGFWGFSLPFISDNGDGDTEFMKWKYLAKILGRDNDAGLQGDVLQEWNKGHDETDMRHELEAIGDTGALRFEPHGHAEQKRQVITHDEE